MIIYIYNIYTCMLPWSLREGTWWLGVRGIHQPDWLYMNHLSVVGDTGIPTTTPKLRVRMPLNTPNARYAGDYVS